MRHFLSIADLTRDQVFELLDLSDALKKEWHHALLEGRRQKARLDGKTLAMYFEKPSLRTRCSFEAGMQQLGGFAINLNASEVGRLGERETISDVARNLSRWTQIVQARVFSHESILELAKWCSVPVINGLSDFEHPTQIIADYQTIREQRGNFEGLRLAWIGDSNNVSHSLMLMACQLGHEMILATPADYAPEARIWALCEKVNPKARQLVKVVRDCKEAVREADVLYTDVWTSMGQEAESKKREAAFAGYQINDELVAAAPGHAFVLHDLPAKRGKEITDSVMDGPRCKTFDQAENRMHAIKAILCWCLEVGF
jgi:ornithine carbamoyltransferase